MKKTILSLIAIVFAASLHAQNGAYINYKLTSSRGANGNIFIKYSEWGTISEFNMAIPQMPGGGIVNKSMNLKSNPDVMYMINDKSKSYSEMKKTEPDPSKDTKTYTVKKLGDETVAGYKCTHALVTEGTETHEVWNTKAIPEYEKYSETFKSNDKLSNNKREKALKEAGCDGIPVKTFHKGKPDEGDMTIELVKLEKKSYSKSDFEIPAGYTKSESGANQNPSGQPGTMKTQQELMNMTPEERAKYIEEMKKQYGKKQ
jgi:hypothetical protein